MVSPEFLQSFSRVSPMSPVHILMKSRTETGHMTGIPCVPPENILYPDILLKVLLMKICMFG